MKNIKVVAFDCDGVMFDTRKANMAYYNNVLNYFGRPPMNPRQFDYSQMHTADEALAYLFNDEERLAAAQAYRKTMSYLPFLKDMEIEPYLKPVLKKLRPKYKTAIATNRADTMNRVLVDHGLKGYFDLVVTANDVENPKPHPDQLVKILEHFETAPREMIYIGDSELDEMAAKATGVRFVAYANNSLAAEFHIKSLKEIEDILNGLNR